MTATIAPRPSPLARAWTARWPIWAEVLLFLALMFTYEWLRSLVAPADGDPTPFQNAMDIVSAEEALGLYMEPAIFEWTQSHAWAEFATTWFYTLGYTTGFVLMFAWVWFRRREQFAAFRNWFWASSLVAVVGYWIYPLAPPRFTEGFGDPTAEALKLGGSLDWFQPFRNEFAAMPSMHCGLAMLMGISLFWLLRPSPWRWLALLWPAGMVFTTMATANHWWLDAVGGLAAIAIALAIVAALMRGQPAPWRART